MELRARMVWLRQRFLADIPIKFIGTGEGLTDFAAFDADSYLDGLLA